MTATLPGELIYRRRFITGLISFVAAPAIVRAGLLMPVKVMVKPVSQMLVRRHRDDHPDLAEWIDVDAAMVAWARINRVPEYWLR